MTAALVLHRGVIRGTTARIELSLDGAGDQAQLIAVAHGTDGAVELPISAAPGRDASSEDRLTTAVALDALPVPLRSLTLVLRDHGGDVEAIAEPDFELSALLPKTDGEFAKAFTWEGQRIRDRETLRFAAAQVVRHADFRASRIAAAASIVAYRSLDLGDEEWLQESLRFIDAAIGRIDELEDTGSVAKPSTVRTDRTHLSISLCTIRWHLALHLGQFDEVMRSLEQGYAFLEPVEEAWSVGYNGSKIVLLYGFMLWKTGDVEQARRVWDFAFVLYQRVAASASNENPTLFNDHRTSHRVAFLAMIGIRNMLGDPAPKNAVIDAKTVGDEVYRVKDRAALGRLRDRMDEMVVWAESRARRSS